MSMRDIVTPRRGKTLLPTLRDAIRRDADPLTASPGSLLGRAEALCKEGDALFEHRDWEGAMECYRAAVALGADHPEARPLLLDALYRRAHARPDVAAYKDETFAACEEALRLDPDCSTATHFLARTLGKAISPSRSTPPPRPDRRPDRRSVQKQECPETEPGLR